MGLTLIDPKTGNVTIYSDPTTKYRGKHGDHGVTIRGIHDERGEYVELNEPIHVTIHDSTDCGLPYETLRKIAEKAVQRPMFWSDDRCCYWMFDFKVYNFWVEMIAAESMDDELHFIVTGHDW